MRLVKAAKRPPIQNFSLSTASNSSAAYSHWLKPKTFSLRVVQFAAFRQCCCHFGKKLTLVIIGVARIFDWGEGRPNHKSHAMISSETLKEEFFCGGKHIAEWMIRSRGLVLTCN